MTSAAKRVLVVEDDFLVSLTITDFLFGLLRHLRAIWGGSCAEPVSP